MSHPGELCSLLSRRSYRTQEMSWEGVRTPPSWLLDSLSPLNTPFNFFPGLLNPGLRSMVMSKFTFIWNLVPGEPRPKPTQILGGYFFQDWANTQSSVAPTSPQPLLCLQPLGLPGPFPCGCSGSHWLSCFPPSLSWKGWRG